MPNEETKLDVVPAQIGRHGGGHIPRAVHMMAYEVYCEVYGPHDALIQGQCRGGFGVVELIALLYARNFPRKEWGKRVDEAFEGTKSR